MVAAAAAVVVMVVVVVVVVVVVERSVSEQHHPTAPRTDTRARTTIANFILDFKKPGTIYNCNTHTIIRRSQQDPSPSFRHESA